LCEFARLVGGAAVREGGLLFFFFQAEDGIRDGHVTGVQTCALPISDYGVLCEEEPDDLSRLQRTHVWMIDPMDGTREFIEDRDEFAVQIGLVVDRTPVLGVVYQPTAGKLYYAARGLGAFLDSGGSVSKLHVSAEQVASRLTIVES